MGERRIKRDQDKVNEEWQIEPSGFFLLKKKMPLLLIKLKDWEGTFLGRGAAQREPQQQKGTGAAETQTLSLTDTGWSSGPATGQPAPPGKPTENNVDYSLGAQAAQGSARLLPLSLKPGKVKQSDADSALWKRIWLIAEICHFVIPEKFREG